MAGDPSARSFRVDLDFARVLLADGDIPAARQRLRTAFRNPANRDFGEIVTFLDHAGRLAEFDHEIGGFELSGRVGRALLVRSKAVFH